VTLDRFKKIYENKIIREEIEIGEEREEKLS
jgi:hypothetical protein